MTNALRRVIMTRTGTIAVALATLIIGASAADGASFCRGREACRRTDGMPNPGEWDASIAT